MSSEAACAIFPECLAVNTTVELIGTYIRECRASVCSCMNHNIPHLTFNAMAIPGRDFTQRLTYRDYLIYQLRFKTNKTKISETYIKQLNSFNKQNIHESKTQIKLCLN